MAKEPDLAKELSGGFAWPTLIFAGFCLSAYGLTCWGVLSGALHPFFGAALNTIAVYLSFTPMHDACHGAISGGHRRLRWLDGLVGWCCGLLFVAPYVAFKRLHLRHHASTNDPRRDPDYWVVGDRVGSLVLRCLTIIIHYYRFFLASGGFGGPKYDGERSQAIVSIGLLVSAVWLLVGGGYGQEVLLLWLLPAMLASGILAFTFDWLPHHPHRSRARYKDSRILTGYGLHLLTVAQNLHLIHHLYPRVPFYRYRALYRGLGDDLAKEGVRVTRLWPGGG